MLFVPFLSPVTQPRLCLVFFTPRFSLPRHCMPQCVHTSINTYLTVTACHTIVLVRYQDYRKETRSATLINSCVSGVKDNLIRGEQCLLRITPTRSFTLAEPWGVLSLKRQSWHSRNGVPFAEIFWAISYRKMMLARGTFALGLSSAGYQGGDIYDRGLLVHMQTFSSCAYP